MRILSLYALVLPWAIGLMLLAAPVCSVASEDIDQQRRMLKEVQARIEQLSQNVDKSLQREGQVEKELDRLGKELSALKRRTDRLESQLKDVKQEILAKEKAAQTLRQQIAGREQDVRRRLRAVYRRGEMRLFKVLFEQGSPARVAENFYFLSRLVRRDRGLLHGYRDDWRALQSTLEELERLRRGREKRLGVIQQSQKTLSSGQRTHAAALRKLQRDRTRINEEITRLEEKARRLRTLVKSLETPKTPAYSGRLSAFQKLKGRLSWPGPGDLVLGFGRNYDTDLGIRHESQGITLAQKPEAPIFAVADGEVVFSKPFRGFGKLLILDHGGGYYTLYAQARRLFKKAGDKVTAGEQLGVSGFGGENRLYFEIRRRGTPLDPLQWLKPRP